MSGSTFSWQPLDEPQRTYVLFVFAAQRVHLWGTFGLRITLITSGLCISHDGRPAELPRLARWETVLLKDAGCSEIVQWGKTTLDYSTQNRLEILNVTKFAQKKQIPDYPNGHVLLYNFTVQNREDSTLYLEVFSDDVSKGTINSHPREHA